MGFGERMRREREMRGIALEEIGKATKIGTRALHALEQEDFNKLPGGIFNKGFVRAYARYLGIDEEQAVADYLVAEDEAEKRADAFDTEHLRKLEENWKSSQARSVDDRRIEIPWGALLFLALVVGSVGAAWHYRHDAIEFVRNLRAHQTPPGSEPTPAPTPVPSPAVIVPPENAATNLSGAPTGAPAASTAPAVQAPVPAAPAPAPASIPATAEKGSTDKNPEKNLIDKSKAAAPPVAESAAEGEFVVKLHAREETWVSVTVDGKRVLQGTLIARRETQPFHAKQNIVVKMGNAAGLDITFNGKAQPALGAANEVKTVVFTSHGIQPSTPASTLQ